ncbi:oxidoreductase [Paenibacillus baekrokdamisoli]|uniref:Oxidoreductase n=1 Tax=Paenibacillus baekrokdamisoli TaxID=1712516 RepID=A0A3G9IJH7_9BACL|nr:Gfo/Idh/MocA family oxidoreductase [Paenibacillus baekrokdamisoli]MBB3067657.1 putative dehydrogenase [Paenibacillus baekrokdamisoli]BBH19157.1 oxidoreductase [Paenibacillus baekrokdamisoli]
MRKMKVAVIGCGTIASSQHIGAYARNEFAEIKYLVDVRQSHVEEMAKTYNVPFTETDFRKILLDEEVEAVSICTPNDTHAPIAIACLNAGKHVLCEKPAAINLEQAVEMKKAADRNNKILNIGMVNRYNTAVNRVKQMIDNGELGKIYHVNCSFRTHRAIPGLGGPFTTKAKSGGGVLIDRGVHFLDLIFYSLSQPNVLTVTGAVHSEMAKDMKQYTYLDMWAGPPRFDGTYDVEDYVTGMMRTSGPTISLNGAWAQNIGETAMFVEFLGDKAGIKLQYGGEDFKIYSAEKGALFETMPSFPAADMFFDEIDGFLRSAMENTKDRANIDHVILTSEVMESIYKSAELGKEVSW